MSVTMKAKPRLLCSLEILSHCTGVFLSQSVLLCQLAVAALPTLDMQLFSVGHGLGVFLSIYFIFHFIF